MMFPYFFAASYRTVWGLCLANCLMIEIHPKNGKDIGPGGSPFGFDTTTADTRNTTTKIRIKVRSILTMVLEYLRLWFMNRPLFLSVLFHFPLLLLLLYKVYWPGYSMICVVTEVGVSLENKNSG